MRAATVRCCASLAGLVLSFIACFILLVIAPLEQSGLLWCTQLLSAYEANFSAQDEDGNTAMHLAAAAGHTNTCVFLTQRGIMYRIYMYTLCSKKRKPLNFSQ